MDSKKYKVGDKVLIARPPQYLRLRSGIAAEVVRVHPTSDKVLVEFTQDAGVSSKTWWIESDCLDPA